MSQGYKLVQRLSKPGDASSVRKYYAQAKSNGVTDLNTLCHYISARSSISSADVKAVLDNLNFMLDAELRAGRSVHIGEFGSFRMSLGSAGTEEVKDFTSSLIRKPKIVFTPGSSLQETRNNVKFQRLESDKSSGANQGNPETGNEQPEEI